MVQDNNNRVARRWAHIVAGLGMLVSFFLPWVKWEGKAVAGRSMPSGQFFRISEATAGLNNPFPQFDIALLLFWLIPVLVVVSIVAVLVNKRSLVIAGAAGLLALSLVTVFVLFSKILLSLGTGNSLSEMIQPWLYVHSLAAIIFVFTCPAGSYVKKLIWILAGPVFAFLSFSLIEKYLENKTHSDTANVRADYTLSADALIREFASNDSAANKKYLDKVVIVNGPASAVEVQSDSTSTIRFADSTGSYVIFSFEKTEYPAIRKLAVGNPVSVKGVCSGSIFSEILGTTSISFKRAILNKQ